MDFVQTHYGFLLVAPGWALVLGVLLAVGALGFVGAPLWVWTAAAAVALYGLAAPLWLWAVFGAVAVVFNLRPVRRVVLSGPIMHTMRRMGLLPQLTDTQRTAIEAGATWIEGEFFSGKPDFDRLRAEPYPELSDEEQAFLDGPVETLCRMADDWQIQLDQDLPRPVWDYIKRERFWGLIIPKQYGGRGLSPAANSAVITRIGSRSVPLAVTVMVPNSLGPAELLLHYGTPEQKEHYLPRLARGEEIPCFALTEPRAGSDAGSITSSGVVFRGDDGELYLRLNWKKRYITLAAVSTVLGLAFQLRDPDNLLGRGEEPGITCALIPTRTPGVVLGRRHDPLGMAFVNSPTEGHDVVVPVSAIIGGPEQAGNGWRMLTESLAEGRGVSLPAQSAGGTALVARVVSAYAAIRQQFGLPLGRFEGIEEPLARIGGMTYMTEAVRRFTTGGIESCGKPAVISAIAKYTTTEMMRKVSTDGMDIVGGAGISRGPRNLLASSYVANPIGITVEGANILTRTLIIYGQGAFRAHPFVLDEMQAIEAGDVRRFDRAFFGHVGFVIHNVFRAGLLSLTRGALAAAPSTGATRRYYRKLAWSSASFALLSDVAMGSLGGSLQRREKVTGRFADILCWQYIATATLRRFEAGGSRPEELPLVHWSMQYAFARIQEAFDAIYANFPGLLPGALLRGPVALWSRLNPIGAEPDDALGARVAHAMQHDARAREALTATIHVPTDVETEQLARLELAWRLVHEAAPVYDRIAAAVRARKLPKARPDQLLALARDRGLITAEEHDLVLRTEEARDEAIAVDAFITDRFPRVVASDAPPTRPAAAE